MSHPVLPALAWLFLIHAAAFGAIPGKADSNLSQPKSVAEVCDATSRVLSTVSRLRVDGYGVELVSLDKQPSVQVDGCAGYRMVFRQEYRIYSSSLTRQMGMRRQQEPEYTTKYSHAEIVVFPVANRPADSAKSKIPWQKLEQRRYVLPVAMGEGHGYAWFGQMTILEQDEIRRHLGLKGGDDPIRLALAGLKIQDNDSTPDAIGLVSYGEASIPYIEEFVKNPSEAVQYKAKAISALGSIRSDKSTQLLRGYYRSDDGNIRDAAALGLLHDPRPEAKAEYLDMVRRQLRFHLVANVCSRFGWPESVPLLQDVYRHPQHLWNSRLAFETKRKIEGREIPAALLAAEGIIANVEFPGKRPQTGPTSESMIAVDTIAASSDKEAATMIAVMLSLHSSTKGYKSALVNRDGKSIINLLPSDMVKSYLSDMSGSLERQDENKRVKQLLDENFGKK